GDEDGVWADLRAGNQASADAGVPRRAAHALDLRGDHGSFGADDAPGKARSSSDGTLILGDTAVHEDRVRPRRGRPGRGADAADALAAGPRSRLVRAHPDGTGLATPHGQRRSGRAVRTDAVSGLAVAGSRKLSALAGRRDLRRRLGHRGRARNGSAAVEGAAQAPIQGGPSLVGETPPGAVPRPIGAWRRTG